MVAIIRAVHQQFEVKMRIVLLNGSQPYVIVKTFCKVAEGCFHASDSNGVQWKVWGIQKEREFYVSNCFQRIS